MARDRTEDESCPHHSLTEEAINTVVGNLTFHELSMIISGVCAGIAVLIMLLFKFMHATHLSNPSEQVKIMRISFLITAYAIVSLVSVCRPQAEIYVHPWLDVIEGTALGSFFLLLCEFISPHQEQQEIFFAAKRKGGVKWFKARWVLIFQFPVVALILAIATVVTAANGTYCEWSSDKGTPKFWIRLIGTIALGMSVVSILQFYKILKVDLAHHRPMVKLFAFKAVVGLTFLQSIIFWILTDTGVLKESDTLTFADVHIGIPSMIICIETIPMALFFCYAYPYKVYLVTKDTKEVDGPNGPIAVDFSKPYQGGPMGVHAWLSMLNPSDTMGAIVFAIKEIFGKDKKNDTHHSMGSNEYAMERQPLHHG